MLDTVNFLCKEKTIALCSKCFLSKFSIGLILSTSLLSNSLAFAEKFTLSTATIEDINNAFDAGALNSETLVELYLARIAAYDNAGPALHSVITLNPEALKRAKELDLERQKSGRRSPLHGIPIVLKDTFDAAGMPTTAGSYLLRKSFPPDDAFIVNKLREAGAIILAKLNMSELYAGVERSSLGGYMHNPHNPARSAGVSSTGTGIAMAAVYAAAGLGGDTGGSIRMPASANGIVGLKTTHGLLSRDGDVPLAPSLDVAGPMARNVYDVAAVLGVMTGVDSADPATQKSKGKFEKNYTRFLKPSALKGVRIGVARQFFGQDQGVDWVSEAALETMEDAGATLVDISFPDWVINSSGSWFWTVRVSEFEEHLTQYLSTLKGDHPKTFDDLIEQSKTLMAPVNGESISNPDVWGKLKRYKNKGDITSYDYDIVRKQVLPMLGNLIEGILAENNVDVIVYPTFPCPPRLIDANPKHATGCKSPLLIANLTGFPELVIPVGFSGLGMPVSLSLLGPAFSEPLLLGLGYSLEQQVKAYRLPVTTPSLAGEIIEY